MKSFYAIPRPSLFAAFTILISLVVCLAGFTEAEVLSKESETRQVGDDAVKTLTPIKGNIPYFQTNLGEEDDELTNQKSLVGNEKNVQDESAINRFKHSDNFGDDFDSEKESDGYGYDDDEYYHFNCKRNNDANDNSEGAKLNKESSGELLQKERLNNPNYPGNKNQKDDQKETETIELLNFKEIHPNPSGEPVQTSNGVAKPFAHENVHKKTSSSPGPIDTLNMSDLKQNSAIDEKMKDRKDESDGLLGSASSDQKVADTKKLKASEEKDSLKLKDIKVAKDTKEKEINLKEEKSNVAGKNLKEAVKHKEEKDKLDHDVKNVKLSEGSKYEDKVAKFAKSKDLEPAKVTKEGKDDSEFIDNVMSHMGNPNRISQINRANFVGSDFKEGVENIKQAATEEDGKNLEELNKNEKSVNLNEYTVSLRDGKDNLRNGDNENHEFTNKREDNWELAKNVGKITEYLTIPVELEAKNDPGDYYSKRDSWKEHSKMQHNQQQHEQQYDQNAKGLYRFNFPATELDNTEYHKNYLKYLKRYKSSDENSKVLNPEPPGSVSTEEKTLKEKSDKKKKKRSKQKYRRSMGTLGRTEYLKEIMKNPHYSVRRNAQGNKDMCAKEPQSDTSQTSGPQTPSRVNGGKENAEENLQRNKKNTISKNAYRNRRKSPQKFEYEIKIINQNQAEAKNSPSLSYNKRKKKDTKNKLLDQNEDKNVKKYTYSQVSKDYLTKHNRLQFNDKKVVRKAPAWSQTNRETWKDESGQEGAHVKVRAAPSGYYSNRVKFGQKHSSRNDEEQTREPSPTYANRVQSTDNIRVPSPYESSPSSSYRSFFVPRTLTSDEPVTLYGRNRFSSPNGNFLVLNNDQQSWSKEHDPTKRFDSGFFNKERASNSLLLVKKDRNGDRIAKTFVDANKGFSEENLDSDQLAKMLSKDSDYVVLRKTDKNQFQKISDSDSSGSKIDSESSSFPKKKFDLFESGKEDTMKGTSKQSAIKGSDSSARSYHSDDDKKYLSKFHNSVTKSTLKKPFNKFRDLVYFFRDNNQESSANQHLTQELKEASDIVFSEDKMPDPIVINNDISGKSTFKSKSPNSISSISTNFKTLDQEGKSDNTKDSDPAKNLFISEVKNDNTEPSWEPALKSAFPEAKTINSIQKNGNEIIVLDFDRNQLKPNVGGHQPLFKNSLPNKQGSAGLTPDTYGSLKIPGDRQIVLSDSNPAFLQPNLNRPLFQDKKYQTDKGNQFMMSGQDGNSLILSTENNAPQGATTFPKDPVVQFPQYFKTMSEKKPVNLDDLLKIITKKQANMNPLKEGSPSYNQFMRDLHQLSEINNEGHNIKEKLMGKRFSSTETALPSSSFPELSTYSDANVKYIGNLLQYIMANENLGIKGNKDVPYLDATSSFNNMGNDFQKSSAWDSNAMKIEADSILKPQGLLNINNDRQKNYAESREEKGEFLPDEIKKDMKSLLESEGLKGAEESNYQNELWEEIAAASDKIQRLRREGIGKRKLRKAIEDALTLKERRQSEKNKNINLLPEMKTKDESNLKTSADSNFGETKSRKSQENLKNSNNLNLLRGEKSDKEYDVQMQSRFKGEEDAKGTPQVAKTLNSDVETHLSRFIENLNLNTNQMNHLINSNEGKNKRKRRHLKREKRFASRFNRRVSRNEVQNKILKLAEDNYESVYSPGIKRKLLSSKEELEDTDGYYEADKQVTTGNPSPFDKNFSDNYLNPLILNIFESKDSEEHKNRARRSLISAFHSNYKREIDLDESMPNDFQNFLVTSLGGFGSQKREVVKKDEALWEGKETNQDRYNQINENSAGNKETSEDSALEKREVSVNENVKHENIRKVPTYEENESDSENSEVKDVVKAMKHTSKKIRSQSKSGVDGNSKEFEEEKVPTHIRIQITKASTKEKKSSKPILEENENSSNEMEKVPTKENEFFEKNKLNLARINPQRSNLITKSKYSQLSNFGQAERDDNSGRQKVFVAPRPYHRGKRKKKKYIQESATKPIKDFMAFDQKAMESFVRKYFADQNVQNSPTTQKMPVSNHLPQVETVYNPTQGTNKAQLETHRLNKLNPLNAKNAANAKNSLQSNDASGLDEDILRSYLKDKPAKAKVDKGTPKEFEEVDWKPYAGKMRLRQESGRDNQLEEINSRNYKNLYMWPSSYGAQLETSHTPRLVNSLGRYSLYQPPYNSYLYQSPTLSSMSIDSAYDSSKFKQDNQNWSGLGRERPTPKSWRKPYLPESIFYKQEDKEKGSNSFPSSSPDASTSTYDYILNKKPLIQKFKSKDYLGLGIKNPMNSRNKLIYTPSKYMNYLKNIDDEKQSAVEASRSRILDNTKESDYLDTADDKEYLDDEIFKQDPRFDDPIMASAVKKLSKAYETNARNHLFNYKNSEIEDSAGEEEEDVDEDYDENIEDDEMNDYSYLARTNSEDPEYMRNIHGNEKFHAGDFSHAIFPKINQFELRGTSFEQAQYKKGKGDDKFEPGKQKLTLTDVGNDLDPFGGTLNALKKTTENTSIFGKNLMKNLNRYSYDDNWKDLDKIQEDKSYEMPRSSDYLSKIGGNKRKIEWQNKLKRSHGLPRIGSRLFYAAKSEMYDTGTARHNGISALLRRKDRKTTNSYYKLSKRNPLNAELRGTENEFEYESEENGNHFCGNLINNGSPFLKEKKETDVKITPDSNKPEVGNTKKRNSNENESFNNIGDVKENLENDGETIADDNILENVIGKYIVRKSVTFSPISKLKKPDIENNDSDLTSEYPKMHKTTKRSVNDQIYNDNFPRVKVLRKRLSSGHLTENNFRKYHKKNLNKKRQMTEVDTDICGTGETALKTSLTKKIKGDLFKRSNIQVTDDTRFLNHNKNAKKRSALDIFRKITNKDKDSKKAENADPRTAGFEPLLSQVDKKYEGSLKDFENIIMPLDKKLSISEKNNQRQFSFLKDLEKQNIGENKKEKSKEYFKPKADEPWKIELNERYDMTLAERRPKQNSLKSDGKAVKMKLSSSPKEENQDLKTYLVIQKNVKASKRNSDAAAAMSQTSGTSQTEVGKSYRHISVEGAGNMERRAWKRSLKSSAEWLKGNEEDASETEPSSDLSIKMPNADNYLSIQETNRALHDAKGLSERDLKVQAPHVVLRNTENTGFVNVEAENKNIDENFPSRGRSFNRKSIFPPPSDANIIGDSRHLNEETSKYLGQQIVEAIFAHVGSNPRLKKLIAPGLAQKTSRYQEDIEDKRRALNEGEFSEQVQTILQKVMFEIEKLAEKRVKRRMCNKLDQQSKEFLQSLLSGQPRKDKDNKSFCPDEDICPILNSCSDLEKSEEKLSSGSPSYSLPSFWAASSTTTTSVPSTTKSYLSNADLLSGFTNSFYTEEVSANLKKKQLLLRKLVNDYQHLSQLEKQNLDVNYRYLLHELDETNRALNSINYQPCVITNFCRDMVTENNTYKTNFEKNINDLQAGQRSDLKNSPPCENNFTTVWNGNHITTKSPLLSIHTFEQLEKQPVNEKDFIGVTKTATTPLSVFQMESSDNSTLKPNPTLETSENMEKLNFTDLPQKINSMSTSETPVSKTPIEFEDSKSEFSLATPETFDLLPSQTTPNSSTSPQPVQTTSESVHVKQSLPREVSFESPNASLVRGPSFALYEPPQLHKLGIGDAAGLELSLKYRGPWVSNLNLTKGLPSANSLSFPTSQTLRDNSYFYDAAMDGSFVGNPATSSSLVDSNLNQYPSYPYREIPEPYYYKKSAFPYEVDRKFFTAKINPFQRFQENRDEESKQILPMQYYLRKFSVPEMIKNKKAQQKKNMQFKTREKFFRRNKRHSCHSVPRRSRWAKRQIPKDKPEKEDNDLEENPGLEYLIWSSMPAVRRRLNDLEMDLDSPKAQILGPKTKNTRNRKSVHV